MKKINQIVRDTIKRDDFIFIIIAVVFAVILSQITIGADDAELIESRSAYTLLDILKHEMQDWRIWSSRVIVNFIANWLLGVPRWIWCVYMCISCFVLQKAISLLFVTQNKKIWNLFISFLTQTSHINFNYAP